MKLTNELAEKLTDSFTKKVLHLPTSGYTHEEWVRVIVGTVIADTALIIEEVLSPEAYFGP